MARGEVCAGSWAEPPHLSLGNMYAEYLLGVLLAHSPQLSAASEELKTAFSPKVMEGHDLFYVEA